MSPSPFPDGAAEAFAIPIYVSTTSKFPTTDYNRPQHLSDYAPLPKGHRHQHLHPPDQPTPKDDLLFPPLNAELDITALGRQGSGMISAHRDMGTSSSDLQRLAQSAGYLTDPMSLGNTILSTGSSPLASFYPSNEWLTSRPPTTLGIQPFSVDITPLSVQSTGPSMPSYPSYSGAGDSVTDRSGSSRQAQRSSIQIFSLDPPSTVPSRLGPDSDSSIPRGERPLLADPVGTFLLESMTNEARAALQATGKFVDHTGGPDENSDAWLIDKLYNSQDATTYHPYNPRESFSGPSTAILNEPEPWEPQSVGFFSVPQARSSSGGRKVGDPPLRAGELDPVDETSATGGNPNTHAEDLLSRYLNQQAASRHVEPIGYEEFKKIQGAAAAARMTTGATFANNFEQIPGPHGTRRKGGASFRDIRNADLLDPPNSVQLSGISSVTPEELGTALSRLISLRESSGDSETQEQDSLELKPQFFDSRAMEIVDTPKQDDEASSVQSVCLGSFCVAKDVISDANKRSARANALKQHKVRGCKFYCRFLIV